MIYSFEAFMPTKIVFGKGKVNDLGEYVKGLGKKAMIVTGRSSTKKSGLLDRVVKILKDVEIDSVIFDKIIPNPVLETVDEGSEIARNEVVDFVIGLGGGSAIDSSKAIAIAACSGGSYWDYTRVGGGKKPKCALPIIAIPTTHGTGTEADPFMVITNRKTKEKLGQGFGELSFPKVSIVDPETMVTLPQNQTAYTSMDAFYHSLEAFININAYPYSDVLALDSMKRVVSNLRAAYEKKDDIEARTELAWASTEAGITETLTGVVANHALEHGLSGFNEKIIHGLGLCTLGPSFLEYIFDHAYQRIAIIAREVFGVIEYNDKRAAFLGIKKLWEFQEVFGCNVPIRDLGISKDSFEEMAKVVYGMFEELAKVTPGGLNVEDFVKIYEMAW
jgi:alcohol dehydrogenase